MRKYILSVFLLLIILFICEPAYSQNYFTTSVSAGNAITTGLENTGVGTNALYRLTTGRGNVALGAYAGRSQTTTHGCIYIGYMAGEANTTAHKLFINNSWYPTYGIFGTMSSGYFGINNTSPSVALDVTGALNVSTTSTLEYVLADSIVVKPTAAGANYLQRWKSSTGTTVAYMDSLGGLDMESNLNVNGTLTLNTNNFSNYKQVTEIIDAADALTASQSGLLSIYRPLTAKRTATLPECAAGLIFEFMVADADSLLIKAASGDSLITSAGAAYVTQSSVAGTVRLVAIDTVRWIMVYTLGTWTGY